MIDEPSEEHRLREIALRIWREREMRFPPRVRRLVPDDLDLALGAWAIVVEAAKKEFDMGMEHALGT